MKTLTANSTINKMLKACGRTEKLVRGKDYYYVTGVAVSSTLYVFRLDHSDKDLQMAIDHVEDVLSAEDGKQFKF